MTSLAVFCRVTHFALCCDHILGRSNSRKGRFILFHCLGQAVHCGWGPWSPPAKVGRIVAADGRKGLWRTGGCTVTLRCTHTYDSPLPAMPPIPKAQQPPGILPPARDQVFNTRTYGGCLMFKQQPWSTLAPPSFYYKYHCELQRVFKWKGLPCMCF